MMWASFSYFEMTLKLTFLFFEIMTYRTLKVREIKGQ